MCIKGIDVYKRQVYGHISNGYVSGAPLEDQIAKSLLGSRGFVNYLMPGQVLNYIEAHDNYNLNDLMQMCIRDRAKNGQITKILLINLSTKLVLPLSLLQTEWVDTVLEILPVRCQ